MARDKKALLEISKNYLNKEDVARLDAMLSMGRESFMQWTAENMIIHDVPQYCSTSIVINESPTKETGYKVCTISISNKGKAIEDLFIALNLDHAEYCTKKIQAHVGNNEFVFEVEPKDYDSFSEFIDKSVLCEVFVKDRFERVLSTTSCIIKPALQVLHPKVEATIEFSKESAFDKEKDFSIGMVHIVSQEDLDILYTISISSDDSQLLTIPVSTKPKESKDVDLHIPVALLETPHTCLAVSVTCRDMVIAEGSKAITLREKKTPEESPVPLPGDNQLPSRSVFCNVSGFQSVIDPHVNSKGEVGLMTVGVTNKEDTSQVVHLTLILNGSTIDERPIHVSAGGTTTEKVSVSIKSVSFEESKDYELITVLKDSDTHIILRRSNTIFIRSKYDLDLRDIVKRTAEFINPHSQVLKDFVVKRDGPVAKAMGRDFMISGYQDLSLIYSQISAVWNAVRDYRMSYVSDTAAVSDPNTHFQRVRTPERVLSDHSGNCIELSILFASLFEIMGFEPIVAFPKGHAIVGFVVRTNAYPSDANYPEPTRETDIVRLQKHNTITDAIFIESTLCRYSNVPLSQAIDSAKTTISSQLSYIVQGDRFSSVELLRRKGVKPTVW